MADQNNGAAYGTALSGVGSLFAQYQSMLNQGQLINPTPPPQIFDAYGDPQYNLGNLTQQTLINPQGAQGGEILSGAGSGASTGAALGSVIPGLGTAVGAIGGAIIGAGSAIFGGSIRKKEMEKRRRLALANLALAQKNYGINKQQFLGQQLGMGDYNNDKNNSYNRLTNLYMAQSGQTEL